MAEREFKVVVRVLDEHAVLTLKGDVDAYTGPSLAEYLDAAVAETSGDVTLNLADVDFVDSSGIAVLVGAAKKLRERDNELIVESPPAMVAKLLEMTGVTRLVRVKRSGG